MRVNINLYLILVSYFIIINSINCKRKDCPLLGTQLVNTSHGIKQPVCKCKHNKRSHHHNYFYCRDTRKGPKVYILKGRWWNESLGSKTLPCPFGYCRNDSTKGESDYRLLDVNNQCAEGREGRLCSQCKKGLSVMFLSEDCEKCTNYFILIIPGFLILLSLLILVIIYFNVNAFSGYFNACLYSYQVMGVFIPKYVVLKLDKVTLFILFGPGLQGTGGNIKFCLFDGMDNLDKIGLVYLFPVWMILFTVFINYLPDSFWKRITKRQTFGHRNTSICRALSFIAVLCYSLITTVTLDLLDRVTVENNKDFVYRAAFVEYLHGSKHMGLFAFALVIGFVFVVGFPVLLLVTPFVENCFSRHMKVRLQPTLDILKFCFKRKMMVFSAFYFICRLSILLITVSVKNDMPKAFLLAMVSCLFLVIFAICKPYHRWNFNFWDLIQLGNICLISIIGLLLQVQSAMRRELRNRSIVLLTVLIYVPLAIAFSRIISFMVVKKMKDNTWCCYQKWNNLRKDALFGNEGANIGHPVPQRVRDSNENETFQNSLLRLGHSIL
ncbi:uncharacterized protein [Clytia hemisphaerica]|uniref:uncharacterized protein n=1 Tax=Clytia hemisphaerica TaxID=252671 RepID=UPI0034D6B357